MANSLGQDWLRSGPPPEHTELWAKRFEIKSTVRLLEGAWLLDFLPPGCLDDQLQLPAFPSGRVFGWEGTPSTA